MSTAHKYEFHKKETIGGKIYFMSPARYEHSVVVANLFGKIYGCLKDTGCKVFPDNLYVILDEENKFIPDIAVTCDKNKATARGYEGAPKFVAEILSSSTIKKDKLLKKEAYEKFGVEEYWIIDIKNKSVEQYFLTDAKYSCNIFVMLPPDELDELNEDEKAVYTEKINSTSLKNFEASLNDIFDL